MQIKFRECSPPFSSECFVFPFPLIALKDYNIQNYNSVVLYGCEIWSLTHIDLWCFRTVLMRIFGRMRKWWDAGENCIRRSVITCIIQEI
jgi:hypothetical protein